MNPAKLAAHLQVDRYGPFWLTEAIRPSAELAVVPEEGFRVGTYHDAGNQLRVPVLAAAVSRERLMEAFISLLEPLGEVVDVVLETSHEARGGRHRDLFRDRIDLVVLASHFLDFEDLLLHDGCTGVAVVSTALPIEVQFDEHKLLIVYAPQLRPFEAILRRTGIPSRPGLKLISEARHFHSSDPRHRPAFQQFCYRLGVIEPAEPIGA